MKVDKELIEKYHLGLCSAEEEQAVENWLLDTSEEEELDLKAYQKAEHKKEMWAAISETIPDETPVIPVRHFLSPLIKKGIAASLVIGLLSSGAFWWWHEMVRKHPVEVINKQNIGSEKIEAQGLNIFLGSKSKANINASSYHKRGNIEFCGMIMINPEEDIELTLNDNCKNPSQTREKMLFKKGQKYIAVNYHFNTDDELIVVDKKNLVNLPPALKREIMKQFNI